MLVFYKERLVILAVPKTGSTALQTALRSHADIVIANPPELKHAAVFRYNRFFRPMFEKVCNVEMDTIAVMREPVSWLGSWYRYRRRPFLAGHPNSTHDISFDDFVQAYTKGKRPGFADVGSQATFLESRPNRPSVSHLFRYEDSTRLHGFLEDRLGISFSLNRENVSPEMNLALSLKTDQKLRLKCADEFDLYNSLPDIGNT